MQESNEKGKPSLQRIFRFSPFLSHPQKVQATQGKARCECKAGRRGDEKRSGDG